MRKGIAPAADDAGPGIQQHADIGCHDATGHQFNHQRAETGNEDDNIGFDNFPVDGDVPPCLLFKRVFGFPGVMPSSKQQREGLLPYSFSPMGILLLDDDAEPFFFV